ncbi:hypothetical protein [Epilithonimonas sp.]|uniref:hypothetical protein n=1 Tax=Epilithonimonas sp. TaxID=2894511 RepID=UPI0035B0A718
MNIKIEKIRYVFDISLQGADGIAGDTGILKLERAEEVALQLRIGGRRALQSFDDEGIPGEIEIFFHCAVLVFVLFLWQI